MYPVIVTGIHNNIGRYVIKPCKSNYNQAVRKRGKPKSQCEESGFEGTHIPVLPNMSARQ